MLKASSGARVGAAVAVRTTALLSSTTARRAPSAMVVASSCSVACSVTSTDEISPVASVLTLTVTLSIAVRNFPKKGVDLLHETTRAGSAREPDLDASAVAALDPSARMGIPIDAFQFVDSSRAPGASGQIAHRCDPSSDL